MDLEQAKQEKVKLEATIHKLIVTFEHDTNLEVNSVDMLRTGSIGREFNDLVDVTLDVKLK